MTNQPVVTQPNASAANQVAWLKLAIGTCIDLAQTPNKNQTELLGFLELAHFLVDEVGHCIAGNKLNMDVAESLLDQLHGELSARQFPVSPYTIAERLFKVKLALRDGQS